jgi:CRISPR/Cas system CSM-associated protein Csm3 (group 7 of RAMP superfamily)
MTKRLARTVYDNALVQGKVPADDHNPNPFDFVFFADKPSLFDIKELGKDKDLYSGYLSVTLKTLTPLHIVGKQDPGHPKGNKIGKSHFYKEGNFSCIPGSSIRGMLRSFIEALTNGWVSQAQETTGKDIKKPAYPKVYGTRGQKGRHVGFDSFKPEQNLQPAIPPKYKPGSNEDGKIDIASCLFGCLLSEDKGGRKGKVFIEDAYFNSELKEYDMVDINDSAFMGGAHPSASNWWYFMPKDIWNRTVRIQGRAPFDVAEMIGEEFWGRKFYFHQDPVECIRYYQNPQRSPDKWQSDNRRPLYSFKMSCLDKEKTVTFRINVERLPKVMLDLLCLCLMPGEKIRHKLGYGKQYGYGSVTFSIDKVQVREENKPLNITQPWCLDYDYSPPQWDKKDEFLILNGNPIIHQESLKGLAKILGRKPNENILCTYPPFTTRYFKTPIRQHDYAAQTTQALPPKPNINSNQTAALIIAKNLWPLKRTIHFLLYQYRSKGYRDIIMQRIP